MKKNDSKEKVTFLVLSSLMTQLDGKRMTR